jgi:hypothetical protein
MVRWLIVTSSRRLDDPAAPRRAGRFQRARSTISAFLVASAAIGVLLAAIVLGSIIAAVLIILAAIAFLVITVRAAWFPARPRRGPIDVPFEPSDRRDDFHV